ncbi:MAG TPA: ankyrin repeat domain-containing protein [Vicinamibacterales bacterium]|jgi:ankyrin repeat protein
MSKTRIIAAVKNLDLKAVKQTSASKPALLRVWDDRGRNLLHLACSVDCDGIGQPESAAVKMVTFLLDSGLDIEEDGGAGTDLCKPIWFAVCRGRNAPLVKYMIKRGAEPTGLYAAGWWEDINILNMLVDAGADMEVVVGVTPFLACWGWKKFKAAKALVLKGANVNAQDQKGRTALHIGVEKEYDPALLKWMVAHGADPSIPDRDGVTAWVRAARKRNKKWAFAL